MSSEVAIKAHDLGKSYPIFNAPLDRLKQMVMPRVQYAFGCHARQYFREFWALKGVSLEVRRGETVGIIGRNGSGKSTLLQIVCGTLRPTTGQLSINGRVAGLLELGAGFNPEFTGRENAILNGHILGFSSQAMQERIQEIEAFADVGQFFDQPVKLYSSGMYVRVAFAVQACVEPDILVIDEALAVGDVAFQAKCLDRIRKLSTQGTTILFVSHDVGSVRTFCDRAIWLEHGKISMSGSVVPVTSAYLGSVLVATAEEKSAGPQTQILIGKPDVAFGSSARPLAHWGSRVGLIQRVGMFDSNGGRKVVFNAHELIVVRFNVEIPKDLDRDHLAAAFSIKTLSGIDIISTSLPLGEKLTTDRDQSLEIEFRFANILNTAKYMLSLAVERRRVLEVDYIEHIDGIYFFQSVQTTPRPGLVVPEINTIASTLNAGP